MRNFHVICFSLLVIFLFFWAVPAEQEDIPATVQKTIQFRNFMLGDSFSLCKNKMSQDKQIRLMLSASGDTLQGIYRTTQWGYESAEFNYLGEGVTAAFLFNKNTGRLGQILVEYKVKKSYNPHKTSFGRLNDVMKNSFGVAAAMGFGPGQLMDMQRIRHFYLADSSGNLLRVFSTNSDGLYLVLEYENPAILNEGFGGIDELPE